MVSTETAGDHLPSFPHQNAHPHPHENNSHHLTLHRVISQTVETAENAIFTDPVDPHFEPLHKTNQPHPNQSQFDHPIFPQISHSQHHHNVDEENQLSKQSPSTHHLDHPQSSTRHLEKHQSLHSQNNNDQQSTVAYEQEKFDNGLTDQTNYLPTRTILLVLMALDLAVFLSFMDQTIVSTALPIMADYFKSGRSGAWISSAYFMLSTGMLPVWGRLSDVLGRKYALLLCVSIFLLGSLMCAVAQSMTQLIFFRGVQGIGGGGLSSLAMVIIADIVPLSSRGKYEGVVEASIALSNAIGPVLGGIISQRTTWRWCFWINLPIGAITIITIVFALPFRKVHGSAIEKLKNIDYGGSIIIVGSTTMLLLGLNWGGKSFHWNSGHVIGCIVGGLVGYISFILWEWKGARLPIFPMYLFKVKTVSGIVVLTFFQGACYFGLAYYLPQYIQFVMGKSPVMSGVYVLPMLLVTTVTVFLTGQVVFWTHQYKPSIVLGFCIWLLALGLLSTINQNTSMSKIMGYEALAGIGSGQTFQTCIIAIQASVDRKEVSVATSMRNFVRLLGATISMVVCSVIIDNELAQGFKGHPLLQQYGSVVVDNPTIIWPSESSRVTSSGVPDDVKQVLRDNRDTIIKAYVPGFQKSFYFFMGCIALDLLISIFFVGVHKLERGDDEKMKAKGKALMKYKEEKKKNKHKNNNFNQSATTPTESSRQ